jgi:hypothetical protein
MAKLQKAKLHPRDARSRSHEAWKRNIGRGMRRAKLARQESGLLTLTEAGAELGLSKRFVAETFPILAVGTRRYVRRADLTRWKAGANAA